MIWKLFVILGLGGATVLWKLFVILALASLGLTNGWIVALCIVGFIACFIDLLTR